MKIRELLPGIYLAIVAVVALGLNDVTLVVLIERRLAMHPEIMEQALSRADAQRANDSRHAISQAIFLKWQRLQTVPVFAVRFDGRKFSSRLAPVASIATAKTMNLIATDYRCGYCKADRDAVTNLISTHPDQEFIFLEAPILGAESVTLAENAIRRAMKDKQNYYQIHNDQFDESSVLTDSHDSESDLVISGEKSLLDDVGIKSTPTYILNGKVYLGTLAAVSEVKGS